MNGKVYESMWPFSNKWHIMYFRVWERFSCNPLKAGLGDQVLMYMLSFCHKTSHVYPSHINEKAYTQNKLQKKRIHLFLFQ